MWRWRCSDSGPRSSHTGRESSAPPFLCCSQDIPLDQAPKHCPLQFPHREREKCRSLPPCFMRNTLVDGFKMLSTESMNNEGGAFSRRLRSWGIAGLAGESTEEAWRPHSHPRTPGFQRTTGKPYLSLGSAAMYLFGILNTHDPGLLLCRNSSVSTFQPHWEGGPRTSVYISFVPDTVLL